MASSREFLRSLTGPHVLFAFGVGALGGWLRPDFLRRPEGYPVASALDALGHPALLIALALGLAGAAGALLAKRLTGNTLASACAGALLVLDPVHTVWGFTPSLAWADFQPEIGDVLAGALACFAAGVRLLPSQEIEDAPLFGKRELLAIAALVLGAFCGPVILAAPYLILLSDLAYAPAGVRAVLRRTGRLFVVHVFCVAPAAYFLRPAEALTTVYRLGGPELRFSIQIGLPEVGFGLVETIVVAVAASGLLVLLRARGVSKALATGALFAVAWAAFAELPRYLFEDPSFFRHSILALFGFALLIPTILWRIAIALTQPPGLELAPEAPLPSVPALRDLARGASAAAAPPPRRIDPVIGLRSTVETAVGGAVAAALEQIRLAFRGAQPSEPPGTPVQVLWNRLITGTSGGVAAEEKPDAAIARWNATFDKEMKPRLKANGSVLCLGATPWPLVLAIARLQRAVVLVERGPEPARRASEDLASAANVSVVRHDRGLDSVKDGAFDAVLCVIEPAMQTSAGLLALLRECRRVLRPGGVVGFGHADLALPESQQALTKGSSSQSFVNRQAIETLARLAGFGQFEYSAGVLPTTSIAWLKPPKAAA